MLTVFLPCRKGSQRIPDKNIRQFAGYQFGLIEIKLEQLLGLNSVDKIILSSNDDRILDYANSIQDTRLVLDVRPDWLGASDTTTDQLIDYVPSLIDDGDVLWTHVTSPFLTSEHYSQIIDSYYTKSSAYDSLMTVKKIQGFIWNETGPITYDRKIEKWPRTQTIEPVYEVDSAVFIANIQCYKDRHDRIGASPMLYVQEGLCSIDIDWPDDFSLAEQLFKQKLGAN